MLFGSHEETLVEQAKLLRFGDCCQMVEYWKQHADAAGCEDEAQRRHEARHAAAATTFDEMVDLRAVPTPWLRWRSVPAAPIPAVSDRAR